MDTALRSYPALHGGFSGQSDRDRGRRARRRQVRVGRPRRPQPSHRESDPHRDPTRRPPNPRTQDMNLARGQATAEAAASAESLQKLITELENGSPRTSRSTRSRPHEARVSSHPCRRNPSSSPQKLLEWRFDVALEALRTTRKKEPQRNTLARLLFAKKVTSVQIRNCGVAVPCR